MIAVLTITMMSINLPEVVYAGVGHSDDEGHNEGQQMMQQMRQQHGGHEHEHDFEAMEKLSPEQLERMVALMQDMGLVVQQMDPARGRDLFVETGCVVYHSVNNVGGKIGPSLNAADMPSPMNAFEFAARMWRGASAMTAMQEDLLGDVISLSGEDLADLIAFAHDTGEQAKLTQDQIPENFQELLAE
jgi:hypothetical protein